jgi:ABC-2 type transport system ATP-binding protein
VISAHAITRRYGARTAVDNVSFDVRGGEVFGLLGPNGAGKTSVLRMLAGLIPPSAGTITIGGRSFTRDQAAAIRGRIGFLTETPGLWDNLTVLDNICVYARLFGMPRPALAAELVLRPFDLWDRRGDRAGLLSKGMKQKLALARALVHEPEIVLLDEPTANLDPQTSRMVRDLLLDLRAQGRAVVISTHNLSEVERLADRVALLSCTLIAIGEPAALRRDVFGRRLRVRLASGYPPPKQLAAVAIHAGAHDVRVEKHELSMVLESLEAGTPAIVRRLVDAGAEIREVFEEQPALEEVYLKLLHPKPVPVDPRRGARA